MPPPNLKTGEPVYFYYKSSKNNERDEWKSGKIIAIEKHYAIIQSDLTARKTKVAYEDIRVKPWSDLTRELMAGTVEHYLNEGTELPRRIDGGSKSKRVLYRIRTYKKTRRKTTPRRFRLIPVQPSPQQNRLAARMVRNPVTVTR